MSQFMSSSCILVDQLLTIFSRLEEFYWALYTDYPAPFYHLLPSE